MKKNTFFKKIGFNTLSDQLDFVTSRPLMEKVMQLSKDLWIYGPNTQIVKYIVGGTQKTL